MYIFIWMETTYGAHPHSSKNLLALFAKTISPLWLIFIPRKLNERQLSHWLLFWSNAVSHEFISLKMSQLSQIDTVSTVSLILSQLCTPSQPHPPLPQLLTIKPPIHVHLSTGDQTRGSLSKPQKCKVSTTLWTSHMKNIKEVLDFNNVNCSNYYLIYQNINTGNL